MPTTLLEGPKGFDNNGDEILPFNIIGTSLGDGINYNQTVANDTLKRFQQDPISHPQPTVVVTNTPTGYKYFNFFNFHMPENRQIPLDKVITGVEVVAGPDFLDGYDINANNSNIGSFGSNSGTFKVKCYLHNGSQYSAPLTWDSSNVYSGVSFSENDTVATFTAGNARYKNTDFEAEGFEDVLFGGSNDLSGLNWDPANQNKFGFAITFLEESNSMVAGFFRGIGLRITYDDPPPTPTKVKIKKLPDIDLADGSFIPGLQTKVKIAPNFTTIQSTLGASTSSPTNTPSNHTLNADQLTFDATPPSISSFPFFDVSNYQSDHGFSLRNFGFNIPSTAIIDFIFVQCFPRRIFFPGNSLTDLTYRFFNGSDVDTEVLNKVTNSFNATENFTTSAQVLVYGPGVGVPNSNDFLTPDFINNIVWEIYWRNDIADTDTGATGTTAVFSGGDLQIGAGPTFHPRITVQYQNAEHKKVIIKPVPLN